MARTRRVTLSSLKKKAWKLFSEWVRRKDADIGGFEYCFTCGIPAHWKELQCGHALPGRHNAVLLDEEICRPQCPRCNVFMGGRYEIFAAKLIRQNGLEWFESKLENARKAVKFYRHELEERIAEYKNKLKALDEAS